MSELLEFDPSRGSVEDHLEVVKNRLLHAQTELEQAREDEKPEAQIAKLEQAVEQYQEDVDSLQEELDDKSMGAAA